MLVGPGRPPPRACGRILTHPDNGHLSTPLVFRSQLCKTLLCSSTLPHRTYPRLSPSNLINRYRSTRLNSIISGCGKGSRVTTRRSSYHLNGLRLYRISNTSASCEGTFPQIIHPTRRKFPPHFRRVLRSFGTRPTVVKSRPHVGSYLAINRIHPTPPASCKHTFPQSFRTSCRPSPRSSSASANDRTAVTISFSALESSGDLTTQGPTRNL